MLSYVRSGLKSHTIRWHDKEIIPGPMLQVNASDSSWTVLVIVTEVKEMSLSSVATYLGKQSEWTEDVLLLGMREHYPENELNFMVGTIHHINRTDAEH
ncbi:ASCH domain-containing protein [Pantoea sp. DY-15]|nr:ASCH domain-containing protein [Pantoea sp. DY-15]